MSGWALAYASNGPEVVLQPGDKRDVPHGLLAPRRVEQVLQHAPVDVAVLGLGGATLTRS